MQINLSQGLDLDAQLVVTGRGCIIGQSGSGKSYLVGVMVEELARQHLPFVVIDTEGEYASLKSAFDVLWVGRSKNADLSMDIDFKRLFAECIESDTPIILDVSDELDMQATVYSALHALYAVEEEKRKPYLVIIEEADKFAPQIVKPKVNPVEELSVRGRKRGIGLLVATQRPANVSKNVLAQCSYGFIGRLSIDNDISAVRTLLEDDKMLRRLPELRTGEFLPFGVTSSGRFKVKAREVKHIGSTPVISEAKAIGLLAETISNLRSKPMVAMERERGQSRPMPARVIKPRFTEEQVKDAAAKLLKKQFGLFGKNVEEIDAIENKFVALTLCSLRLPTGRKGEYIERHILINSKCGMVNIDTGIKVTDPGMASPARLNEDDEKVLTALFVYGRSDSTRLKKMSGLKDDAFDRALSRLERMGMLKYGGGKISGMNYRSALMQDPPVLEEIVVPESSVVAPEAKARGRVQKRKADQYAKDVVATLFPGAILMKAERVHLPVYEITLRDRNSVRVFEMDGLFGRQVLINALA